MYSVHDMGVRCVGLHSVGVLSVGLHSVGVLSVGLHCLGVDSVSLHCASLHGVDVPGIKGIHYLSSTVGNQYLMPTKKNKLFFFFLHDSLSSFSDFLVGARLQIER